MEKTCGVRRPKVQLSELSTPAVDKLKRYRESQTSLAFVVPRINSAKGNQSEHLGTLLAMA